MEGEEEDVRNYWMTLRTGEDTLIWRRKLQIALCGGIVLEEALDLSSDRILNEWSLLNCRPQWRRGLRCGSAALACWDCGFRSHRWQEVCLLWVLWLVRYASLPRTDHSSGGVLLSMVSNSVWSWSLENEEALAHYGLLHRGKKLRFRDLGLLDGYMMDTALIPRA
jgi:hypothetical protein